jgi:hypothetical protein
MLGEEICDRGTLDNKFRALTVLTALDLSDELITLIPDQIDYSKPLNADDTERLFWLAGHISGVVSLQAA